MELLKKIFKATTDTLYCVVGNINISNEDFIIGLSTLAIIFAIFLGSFFILHKKVKIRQSLSIVGSLGTTIGSILLFCIICIIVQH